MSKIDAIDRKIVDFLMEDGRMPAVEISRRVGSVSERAVRYRIDRLLREGIIKISAIPQPRSLGFPITADVFLEVEPGMIMEIARKISLHERVSYVSCAIGETDISVQVVARSNEEVYQFATEFVGRILGVHKTTTSIVPITLKDIYQWRIPENESKQDQ